MTLLALTAAVALGDVYLQSLVPTSGVGAEAVLDGKSDTVWRPEGSAISEGILFRFEAAVTVKAVEVTTCPNEASKLSAIFDGRRYSSPLVADKSGKAKVQPFIPFRSM